MKNQSRIKLHLIVYPSIVFLLLSNPGCQHHDENVLAVIGTKTLTTEDFINRYHAVHKKMNLPDNGQVRSETFNNMIDEMLLINEAEARGYRKDKVGQHEIERIKIQELINAYLQSNVFTKIHVRENDLKTLYIRLNTMVKARHLYADSKKRADSLYQRLMSGESFEKIAREVFTDPQLRETGGLLGYFTVDEMDPAFEEKAFSIPIGEISKPVHTAQGYSIIQVLDKKTKPMLTETEYLKNKSKLQSYWLYRLRKRAAQSHSESIRNQLNISFDQPVLLALYRLIKESEAEFPAILSEHMDTDNSLWKKKIVQSSIGSWTVSTLREKAEFTSENQRKWIRNPENLEDFIVGIIVRSYILAEARKMNLNKTTGYHIAVDRKIDDFLYERMIDTIDESVIIPEDSLRLYYEEHKDHYYTPSRIHLSEIVLDDESSARMIKKQLEQNHAFDVLARHYSVRKASAEIGGEIGIYSAGELGIYADRLMALGKEQWTGPLKIDNQYLFFKCLNKFPGHQQTYTEAHPSLVKSLKPIWQKKSKQNILNEIRSKIRLVTYSDKLKLIQMN